MVIDYIAGVDEAGRGPLAGPVVAAAVILDPENPIKGLKDSKKLSAAKRVQLAETIKIRALAWALGRADVEEIDRINILQASMKAMQRAVEALQTRPVRVLVDGNCCPVLSVPVEAIIKGDDLIPAISAASILAKVARDLEMLMLHSQFPEYCFDQHKGYPTKLHIARLEAHGICLHHRMSYAPVQAVIRQKRLF